MRQNNPRGFATVCAIVSVGLIGVTMAGLMVRVSSELHRAVAESEQAQRRQLLLAGNMLAGDERTVKLPDVLATAGASFVLQIDGHGQSICTIRRR